MDRPRRGHAQRRWEVSQRSWEVSPSRWADAAQAAGQESAPSFFTSYGPSEYSDHGQQYPSVPSYDPHDSYHADDAAWGANDLGAAPNSHADQQWGQAWDQFPAPPIAAHRGPPSPGAPPAVDAAASRQTGRELMVLPNGE